MNEIKNNELKKIISIQINVNVFFLVKSAVQVMNWISLGEVSRGSQMLTIQFFERHLKRISLAKAEQQVQSTTTIVFLCVFFLKQKPHSFLFIVFVWFSLHSKSRVHHLCRI